MEGGGESTQPWSPGPPATLLTPGLGPAHRQPSALATSARWPSGRPSWLTFSINTALLMGPATSTNQGH